MHWTEPTSSSGYRHPARSARTRYDPTPEIMPEEIEGDVAVIATGRSDYPNQINNVLAFPGVFRGALDVRASTINKEMELAAVDATDHTRFAKCRKHSFQSIELKPQRIDSNIDRRRFCVVVHVHAGDRPHHGVRTNERWGERRVHHPPTLSRIDCNDR